ncbi:hypothetical protein Tco_0923609 [Tanacetum coccineum]|uniref:Uncharacterized protein n=1 Tax=Tanacetum coccineum TaxID=301880 RepID=A0ABQ5D2T8_9ASTR
MSCLQDAQPESTRKILAFSEAVLIDKKGGSYAVIAPKLEPGNFNKWKKRMLFYLAGMELYYLKCIKDGPFQPKNAEGAIKPKIQWTLDKRKVVVQDQCLKSIIISCLPDDIMESVISCEIAKATWNDLVHSFEGQPYPKKVLMALVDDELTVGKNHARNGEWIDITMRKVNILLFMDEDADWQNYLKYINVDRKYYLFTINNQFNISTLAEHMIVAGDENRPPMLDKSMYDSWQSQNGAIRPKKYVELTEQEQLQDDCDVQATNNILQGLPLDVYSLVNRCKMAKAI